MLSPTNLFRQQLTFDHVFDSIGLELKLTFLPNSHRMHLTFIFCRRRILLDYLRLLPFVGVVGCNSLNQLVVRDKLLEMFLLRGCTHLPP
jgi:hypothetical protein